MSRRNREKRAAKLKDRRRSAAGREQASSFGPDDAGAGELPPWFGAGRVVTRELIARSMFDAARCRCGDLQGHVDPLLDEFGDHGRELDLGADLAVTSGVRRIWEIGWSPTDLHEHARRTLEPPVVEYLREVIVAESRQYAVATLHPRWRAAISAVAAGIEAPGTESPLLTRWAARNAVSRPAALLVVMQVLSAFVVLPELEPLLPLPGAMRHAAAPAGEVDQKVLAKVRALLAKAESTEFPDEAEALSGKAQELMSRYSLHQAVLDHDRGRALTASGRRMWMDAPYAGAKALLVQTVATANRCRAAWTERLGFVTVVGPDTELDIVELLTTSLLLQANRAMLAAGRQVTRNGTSRTRSFRQSFLVAYATRIRERLEAASTAATSEAQAGAGEDMQVDDRLLPVLAARSKVADEMMERLFPEMVSRQVSVSNGAGWGAGLAAADLARLDVHGSIAG